MDMKLNWYTIYGGERFRIEEIIKGLYDREDWQELHVALWTWLSINGEREKHKWFERFNVPAVSHYCFACEMAEISFRCNPPIGYALEEENDIKSPICYYCPLTNPSSEDCLDGLYGKWLTTYLEEREEIATEIANMEWTIK